MSNENFHSKSIIKFANNYINLDDETCEIPDYLKERYPDLTREQLLKRHKIGFLHTAILLALCEITKIDESLFDEVVESVNSYSKIHKLYDEYKLNKEEQ